MSNLEDRVTAAVNADPAVAMAKQIRSDIKAAKKAGTFPADAKVSVRVRRASMMTAVDADVTVQGPSRQENADGYWGYTPAAKAAHDATEAITKAVTGDWADGRMRFSSVQVTGTERS